MNTHYKIARREKLEKLTNEKSALIEVLACH